MVPPCGEADTLQGEIVRAFGRLEDEFSRNGNTNWDPGDYHGEFIRMLKLYLADSEAFDPAKVQRINESAELIRLAAEDVEQKKIGEDIVILPKHDPTSAFEFLKKAVVEWCELHPQPIYKSPGQDFWIT
ncbi:hypothetical protein GC207_00915 [bacterium]|nr:hypothetical protein [bacterium]